MVSILAAGGVLPGRQGVIGCIVLGRKVCCSTMLRFATGLLLVNVDYVFRHWSCGQANEKLHLRNWDANNTL
ncbi:hypothetical protein CORC01_14476 [Colletotrichum orchidophilum]|uniref:Uncharacterized protein n=1 Tax=Colletotrichum orchidophilum TaxID=1209926 RepID=A0A1G4AM92_9PEZI|nr:uncharacterized protein CORC01_14476 [Colletotrichum orchidophilum]OHE90226.1 hypothetical protein CORC01_14476 [Colletotrichum orchidophilum]